MQGRKQFQKIRTKHNRGNEMRRQERLIRKGQKIKGKPKLAGK